MIYKTSMNSIQNSTIKFSWKMCPPKSIVIIALQKSSALPNPTRKQHFVYQFTYSKKRVILSLRVAYRFVWRFCSDIQRAIYTLFLSTFSLLIVVNKRHRTFLYLSCTYFGIFKENKVLLVVMMLYFLKAVCAIL